MGKSTKRSPKGKPKDSGRKFKKKVSVLNTEGIDYVDWKDVNLLRRFVSDRAKIRARRVTGNDVQQQRAIAMAIKNAREMALIPYTSRVTTQRGGRGRDRDGDDRRGRDRDDRGERGDRHEDDNEEVTEEFTEIEVDETDVVVEEMVDAGGEA